MPSLDKHYLSWFFTKECQRLKAQVVHEIRSNQQAEQDLDVMDIKIGLLVKNRISLQDVVSTSQQVKHKDKKSNRHSMILDQGSGVGVGGLSKANHEKIEVSVWCLMWSLNYFCVMSHEMLGMFLGISAFVLPSSNESKLLCKVDFRDATK